MIKKRMIDRVLKRQNCVNHALAIKLFKISASMVRKVLLQNTPYKTSNNRQAFVIIYSQRFCTAYNLIQLSLLFKQSVLDLGRNCILGSQEAQLGLSLTFCFVHGFACSYTKQMGLTCAGTLEQSMGVQERSRKRFVGPTRRGSWRNRFLGSIKV